MHQKKRQKKKKVKLMETLYKSGKSPEFQKK